MGTKMCSYFKNYYVYSSCTQPNVHFIRTDMDGQNEYHCAEGPHDRIIIVVGKCLLCVSRWYDLCKCAQSYHHTRISTIGNFNSNLLALFPRILGHYRQPQWFDSIRTQPTSSLSTKKSKCPLSRTNDWTTWNHTQTMYRTGSATVLIDIDTSFLLLHGFEGHVPI